MLRARTHVRTHARTSAAHFAALSICVVATALAFAPAASSGATPRPSKADACHRTWVRTSVTATHTTPDGTGVVIAETNVSGSFCSLVSPLSVQLLARMGQRVVPPVTTPAFADRGGLPVTYQGTFSLSVRSAAGCARRPLASAIRVTSGQAISLVHLAQPIRVCASHPHPVTVSRVSFPHPPACRVSALTMSAGWPNGTAGTIYYAIKFQNGGVTACTLHGIPTVQPIASDGSAVGPPARSEQAPNHGKVMVLGVSDGVAAWATYAVVESGNFPPSACRPVDVGRIRVTLPGYASEDHSLQISVCTKLNSTNIWGVAPRWITP